MSKQVRSKTHKSQGALTAASKKETSTNIMKTVSEALHKTTRVSQKTSPTFLAVTLESIVGFS